MIGYLVLMDKLITGNSKMYLCTIVMEKVFNTLPRNLENPTKNKCVTIHRMTAKN